MSPHNSTRDGFWRQTLEATTRHEGALDGSLATEVLSPERDEERLARLPSDDGLAFHRVTGGGHMIDVSYLKEGLDVARTVACVRVTDYLGRETGAATGVMVSPRLFLTVAHALPNQDAAARSSVWFDYERDENGVARAPRIFRLEPEAFFYTDPALDFTLVAVEPVGHDGTVVTEFGSVVVMEDTPKVGSKEAVHVVEHPQGGFKQVGLHTSYLSAVHEDFAQFQPGTPASGAAVFNDQWELVALVHAGIVARDAEGHLVNRENVAWDPTHGEDDLQWHGFEGIRISRICETLADEMWTEDEQDFIDELLEADYDDLDEEEIFEGVLIDDEDDSLVGEGDQDGEPLMPTATLPPITEAIDDVASTASTTPPPVPTESDVHATTEAVPTDVPQPPADTAPSVHTPPPLPVANEDLPPDIGENPGLPGHDEGEEGQPVTPGTDPEPEPAPQPDPTRENPPEVEPGPDLQPGTGPEIPQTPDAPDLIPNPVPEVVPPAQPEPTHEPLRGAGVQFGLVTEQDGIRYSKLDPTAYAHLTGFNENFLGGRTPLPRMLPALKQQVAKSNQGIEVLDYTHFSVVMNGRRRTAFFVAANLDPSQARRPEADPVYLFDSRLEAMAQIGPDSLSSAGLAQVLWVRPEEVAWNQQAERGAVDAQHFTNCALCPIAASTPVWNGLVKQAVGEQRACVYAGPVLQPGDVQIRGFAVPMEMWKIVVLAKKDGGLSARGFRQARKPGTDQYETLQCRISEIESLTGLDFGPLRLSDPLASTEGPGRVIASLDEVNA